MTVRVVTDSTADLPPEIVAEHGITVLPLNVLWGEEQLRDGVDITAERFFRRLVREDVLPTTSQPSPSAFRDAYERLRDEGADEIISIHLPERLSGTIESARQGAAGLEGVRVEIVDSGQVSMALGLLVLLAAETAAAGRSLDEVCAATADAMRRTHLFAGFDTLEYLRRGGRIGRAQEVMGGLLKVKPIITFEDGEVTPIGRVRTRSKMIEWLVDKAADIRPVERFAVVHATTPEDLDYLVERLHGLQPHAPILASRLGPVVGTHGGPGVLGFAAIRVAPVATAAASSAGTEHSPPPDG